MCIQLAAQLKMVSHEKFMVVNGDHKNMTKNRTDTFLWLHSQGIFNGGHKRMARCDLLFLSNYCDYPE